MVIVREKSIFKYSYLDDWKIKVYVWIYIIEGERGGRIVYVSPKVTPRLRRARVGV